MITIEGLREFGADADTALKRCLGNEAFYLKQINKVLEDDSFDMLKSSVESNDLDAAFEMAHALKGVWGNLGLIPLFEPVAEMTEHLRNKADKDYSDYVDLIDNRINTLRKMKEDES